MTAIVVLGFPCALWATTGFAQPRTAKVAGQFYPAEHDALSTMVTNLIGHQPLTGGAKKPRVLIVPHAGYQYSGPVAAEGFRLIQGKVYDGVVVVGFTHRMQFDGASVDTRDSYETPLGEIPVHQEAVAILQAYPGIHHVEYAHESDEHSLEVELPFLQVALNQFRLVPILVGDVKWNGANQLAAALAGLSKLGDYLFVFSTDLSHYHPYDEAVKIDRGTVNALLSETPQATERLFDVGATEACGRGPIVASLLLSAKLGYLERQLIRYANSGDTTGDHSRVVGYSAIAMFDQPQSSGRSLSPQVGAVLVAAVRQSLERSLGKGAPPSEVHLKQHSELSRRSGVFVTLRKHGALRGCIGQIETDEPLAKTVPLVALDAALRDPRFPPVTADELPALQIEVSVLTSPVVVHDPSEIVAGRDGVILDYQGHRGIFLPQVWDETGWTRVEFLRELASQKAELPADAWQQARLSTFQAQIFEEPPAPY